MTNDLQLAQLFLERARQDLLERYGPRLRECVGMLTVEQIWWRPNESSNSIGNLLLHIDGQIRQWVIASFNRTPVARDREQEFSERGPIPVSDIIARLESTLKEAGTVLERVSPEELSTPYVIFGSKVSGLEAIFHTVSHFTLHYGQIACITKALIGQDLSFGLALQLNRRVI